MLCKLKHDFEQIFFKNIFRSMKTCNKLGCLVTNTVPDTVKWPLNKVFTFDYELQKLISNNLMKLLTVCCFEIK